MNGALDPQLQCKKESIWSDSPLDAIDTWGGSVHALWWLCRRGRMPASSLARRESPLTLLPKFFPFRGGGTLDPIGKMLGAYVPRTVLLLRRVQGGVGS